MDLSVHFQRCLIMLWILFIPVGILWVNVAPILMALGQDEELSRGTQQYLRVLLLAAPGYIGFETLKKYLQCQGMFLSLCLRPRRRERLTARDQYRDHGCVHLRAHPHNTHQRRAQRLLRALHRLWHLRLAHSPLVHVLIRVLLPHHIHRILADPRAERNVGWFPAPRRP